MALNILEEAPYTFSFSIISQNRDGKSSGDTMTTLPCSHGLYVRLSKWQTRLSSVTKCIQCIVRLPFRFSEYTDWAMLVFGRFYRKQLLWCSVLFDQNDNQVWYTLIRQNTDGMSGNHGSSFYRHGTAFIEYFENWCQQEHSETATYTRGPCFRECKQKEHTVELHQPLSVIG